MASQTSSPEVLSPALTDREAIADALYRCFTGLDTKDPTLFESAFVDDATFTVGDRVSEGLPAIRTDIFDLVAKLDTSHFLTNIRINVDGNKAKLTASRLDQHFRGGSGLLPDRKGLLAGSVWWSDLIRDGDLWKITALRMNATWAEGDWDVVKPSQS